MKLTSSVFKRVAVGVSGGVDSAVAAWMLKSKGHDVHGVFMRNWDPQDESDLGICTGDQDCETAAWVCKKLSIPFTEMNFVSHYWNDVFQYLLSEYSVGRTPNPDVLCNHHIKFGRLAEACKERLDCDWLATGHYARLQHGPEVTRVLRAVDESKDQTFFLSAVRQDALRKAIFPLGGLLKSEVRDIAQTAGLSRVAHKKDSMGICFIGKRDFSNFIAQVNFSNFIAQYVEDAPGHLIDIDTGQVVGEHKGQHHWTLGQCCHLPALTKYYIAAKLSHSNHMLVCGGLHHPCLYSSSLLTDLPHWLAGHPPPILLRTGKIECQFRFTHRAPLVSCTASYWSAEDRCRLSNERHLSSTGLAITLKKPLKVITPGQFAVLYDGEECLGSAKILSPGPSLYCLNTDGCRDKIMSLRQRLPTLLTKQLRTVRREHVKMLGSNAVMAMNAASDDFYALVNRKPNFDAHENISANFVDR
ncbi:tRNA-specific 2-thiouridylase [Trinorchestia longiramus]|nr:tRNA-specific 2-thiouridylase [Trinorchestia longiramus]